MAFKPAYNLIEELRWRGLHHQDIPGTEELLMKEQVKGYIGFDPTADSLHIGNMVPIMLLMHLQRAGHIPVALVGGATGMVGDPSGKSTERNLLDPETIQHNLNGQKVQLMRFLDFNSENAAEVVNNYDWFKHWGFLDFIREVGKHITISYMMSKDSVQNRLESGLSFTEFSYQLVQGYDFYHLYTEKGVKLQMGGSDQWGNIVTGTELIRRKAGGEAYALTAPLLTKSDGSKFGKSEGGNVWLDRNKTSPYKFYQFWLNVSDEEAERLIKIFTLLSRAEIDQLIAEHRNEPHLRMLQKVLAREVTIMVHSKEDYDQSVEASEILFGKSTQEQLQNLDESLLLSALEGVPRFDLSAKDLAAGIPVLDLMAVVTQVFPSKSECRKMIQSGGLSLNKEKVTSDQVIIGSEHLIQNKFLLVQKGKKNYYLLVFT